MSPGPLSHGTRKRRDERGIPTESKKSSIIRRADVSRNTGEVFPVLGFQTTEGVVVVVTEGVLVPVVGRAGQGVGLFRRLTCGTKK